jgi:hypothetical protein
MIFCIEDLPGDGIPVDMNVQGRHKDRYLLSLLTIKLPLEYLLYHHYMAICSAQDQVRARGTYPGRITKEPDAKDIKNESDGIQNIMYCGLNRKYEVDQGNQG